MNTMKRLLFATTLLAACATTAHAYHGSFDPVPFRNVATIRFVDTPTPNLECAKRVHPLQAPLAIATAMGCTDNTFSEVVAAITPSPFWAVIVGHGLTTPQSIIGHEFRHIFDGAFHGALPFINRLRLDDEARRVVLSEQHGAEMRIERRDGENWIRVPGETRQTDCLIFTRDKAVSYHDLGILVAACVAED